MVVVVVPEAIVAPAKFVTDAAAKVAVVTDNIYTTNTTTIDGSNITTGSITANTIAAGSITADKIEADSITANEIKSVDGSAIISRTYKLNGNNISVATVDANIKQYSYGDI